MHRRIRMAASAAVVALVMLAPGFAFAQQAPFNDLGSVPWATRAIASLARQGVLKGIGNDMFGPNMNLSRAEMATVLGRLKHWQAGASEQAAAQRFHDHSTIPGYALPYVGMAAQLGIVQGFPNGNFEPQGTLTWADLAIVVARAFNYPTVAQAQIAGLLGQLVNGAQTPSFAQQAVAEDVQAGDFAGILAELYSPNANVTRAELALFLDQAAAGSKSTPTSSTVASLTITPTPIAAAGSLAAGQTVAVNVYADNTSGSPIAGATVYLSFAPTSGGGSASVGGTALGATPAAFTAGSNGAVTVTYMAPATLPTTGTDTLRAANAGSGATVTTTDAYSFGSTATAPSIATIGLTPNPMAASGSLSAGQTVTIEAAAYDSGGNAIPGATVYLSFMPTSGGGTASVGGTALTTTPAAFTTGSDGTLSITYTAPATLPSGGTDTLTAAKAAIGAAVTATDSYTFTTSGSQVGGATVQHLSITVTTAAGTETYPLAANVTVTKDGQAASLSDITAGDTVTLTLNAQGQVTAVDITSAPSS